LASIQKQWINGARKTVEDFKTGPKIPRSTGLSVEEEAMIVAFRRHSLLSFGRLPLSSPANSPSSDTLIPASMLSTP